MTAAACRNPQVGDIQLATFQVGDLLLGMPIEGVQEINRNLETTAVPHSPDHIRGVINLRGEVATVIDLRRVLGLPPAEVDARSRNLIVRDGDESVGLWVDKISDIITVPGDSIIPPPANVSGVAGKYFSGVYRTKQDIVVILDITAVLAHE